MPKKEAPIAQLQDFLPPHTFEKVWPYLKHYQVHLTVTRNRKTILGDYRNKTPNTPHRISVNGSLNPYAFLITLLHELAHLITFEKFGNRITPHGKEWKQTYSAILQAFILEKIFPEDIEKELLRSAQNPAASSCAEENLLRVLRNYDLRKTKGFLIEDLHDAAQFMTKDGRVFQLIGKMRKRYKAVEIKTGKIFLFSPVYEVQLT